MDFEVVDEYDDQLGSWFKSWIARSSGLLTSEEAKEVAAKVARAIELELLEKVQAETDERRLNGIATTIAALEKTENAAIQIGGTLILKRTVDGKASIFSRTLTQRELIVLERQPSLLMHPASIIETLERRSAELDVKEH